MADELTDIAENCRRQMEDVYSKFWKKFEEIPAPDIIYHYTDGIGLRGILETGNIWFTDIFNLNDPTELRHGLQEASKILDDEAQRGPDELKFLANITKGLFTGNIESMAHFLSAVSAILLMS